MALPLIAAGIAARAVAKKLTSRAAGGITGAGAKSVNPVYKNMTTNQIQKNSVKVQKNSFDTYSKALGGGTLREIHGRMNKRINDAGLKNAQSKGPKPSVKVVKRPEGKLPKRGK
jgi:hypothetical protein